MVEAGIGLVEHHEERFSVECARQSDALALPGREGGAALAHLGFIAVGQAKDHLVHAGRLGRRDHLLGVGFRLEAGDVLGDRAGEQLHVLRQVADMLAEGLGRPLVERGAVDPDLARHRAPDAHQGTGERGLARGAGADDAQALARLQGECNIARDQRIDARGRHADRLDRQGGLGLGQRHDLAIVRNAGQQIVQPVPALAGRDEDAPLGDHLLHGRQRPGRQNGAGDDDARRRLPLDHQIGTDRQYRRLQRHAERPGKTAHAAGDVAGPLVGAHVAPAVIRPLMGKPADHAHGVQYL